MELQKIKKAFNHKETSLDELMIALLTKRGEEEDGFPVPAKVEIEKCSLCGEDAYLFHYAEEVKRYCLSDKCDPRIGPPKSKAQRLVDYYWSFSRVPASLKNARFGNYKQDTEAKKKAFQACNYYAHEVKKDNPIRLFIQGNNGTGKSHLALSVIRKIMSEPKNEMSCLFISEQEIVEMIQSTYNNNPVYSTARCFEIFEKVDLLVIDDLGQQLGNDHTLRVIKNVVNKRSGKALIVTTNMSDNQLSTDRRFTTLNSKLKENAHIVNFITDDYRQRNVQYLEAVDKPQQTKMEDFTMTEKKVGREIPYDLNDPPF